jgi:hypothetical protein
LICISGNAAFSDKKDSNRKKGVSTSDFVNPAFCNLHAYKKTQIYRPGEIEEDVRY